MKCAHFEIDEGKLMMHGTIDSAIMSRDVIHRM
jgi:hypothetical protein